MVRLTRSVKMKFNYIRLGTDIRGTMTELKLTAEDVALLSGVSDTSVSGLMAHNEPNPKMSTFLGVINALDLDPRDYFELEF